MYSLGQLPDSIGDDFARTGLGLVGWCFYRVSNQDESNETIAHPGASIRHRIERKVTIEVLTVDRMLIFFGGYYAHPL